MNKKYIIRKNEDIKKILDAQNKLINKYFVIYYSSNELNYNRYCVSVSKKIGKAYVRNLYKRRIKDILMKFKYNNSCDYVIILRKGVLEINYDKMKNELSTIIKGE